MIKKNNDNNKNDDFDINANDKHFEIKMYIIVLVIMLIIPIIFIIKQLQIDWAIFWAGFFVILLIVFLLFFCIYTIIKNKKYWNFDAFYIFMMAYIFGFFLMFGGIAAFPKYLSLIFTLYIVLLFLSLILSKKINNLVYNKNRILDKLRFKAQNFIRPTRNSNENNIIELANKYCIVRIDSNITCYDKLEKKDGKFTWEKVLKQ